MRIVIVILLLLGGPAFAAGDESTDEPRKSGITEQVDVQLVLLDVTVTDRSREIVMGLTRDDFVLKVDHQPVPIVSLDMACPDGPVPEPPAVEDGTLESDWVAPDRQRRVVFAVDYRHLEQTQRIEVLRNIRAAIQRLHRSNEQVMIVALTEFLRVELLPTTDGDAAIAALDRMENDPTLWLPPFDHLHDVPTFDALYDLTVMLGAFDQDKVVVLYSNWPSSGFSYDDAFDKLTRLTARNRVSFYTVWTRGLQVHGTSRHLARLAVETGGRFTERTNDFSLAYARAQRDVSCRYTLGFHDTREDPDRTRLVDVRVKKRGVRPHYHDHYAPADGEAAPKEVALATLAWPELHASESVQVELLPLRPTSRRRWQAVFVIAGSEPASHEVHVRARLRRGNTRWTRTDEKLDAPYSAAQPIELRHGSYVSSTSVIYPPEDLPRTASSSTELPELVGEHGWWFGDPLVLRSLGPGPVEPAVLADTALENHPLDARVPVLSSTVPDSLSLLQSVCRFGLFDMSVEVGVRVRLSGGDRLWLDGAHTHVFPASGGLHCEAIDEPLPALPVGSYTLEVTVRVQGGDDVVRAREFEIAGPAGS